MAIDLRKYLQTGAEQLIKLGEPAEYKADYSRMLECTGELFEYFEKNTKKDADGALPLMTEEEGQKLLRNCQDLIYAINMYGEKLAKSGKPEDKKRFEIINAVNEAVLHTVQRIDEASPVAGKVFAHVFVGSKPDVMQKMRDDNAILGKFGKEMKEVNRGAFIGSPQFDALIESFKRLTDLGTSAEKVPAGSAAALEEAYRAVSQRLDVYLAKKEKERRDLAAKGKTPSEIAERRTDFARRLQKYISAQCGNREFFGELQAKGTDKEIACDFMNSVYKPHPVFSDEAVEKHFYTKACFDSIPKVDISGFTVGLVPVTEEDFAALAISAGTMPGFGETARRNIPGDAEMSPEVRAQATATMFTADAAGCSSGALSGRSHCFRDEFINSAVIPGRSAVRSALEEYQKGSRNALAEIIAHGLAVFENWAVDMKAATPSQYSMAKTFDRMRNVMERDPELKKAVFETCRKNSEKSAQKAAEFKKELDEVQKTIKNLTDLRSDEFAETARRYARLQADHSFHTKRAGMKPEESLRTLNGYLEAEKIGLRCDEAKKKLKDAAESGRTLSDEEKKNCVIAMLREGTLNAATVLQNKADSTAADAIYQSQEVMKMLANEKTAALVLPFGTAYSAARKRPTEIIRQLADRNGMRNFDVYFENSATAENISELAAKTPADILKELGDEEARKKTMLKFKENIGKAAVQNNAQAANEPNAVPQQPVNGQRDSRKSIDPLMKK